LPAAVAAIAVVTGNVVGCRSQADVQPEVPEFSLQSASPLEEGDSATVHAIAADGAAVQPLQWQSSNTDIIDVSGGGELLARGPGTATVTASSGHQQASTVLTVKRLPLPDLYIVAHRGFAGVFPENTLVAVQGAFERGADAVEVDVAMARDRVPIIMHDDRIDRTTNGTGYVSDWTSTQLHELDACSKFGAQWKPCPVPLASEVLDAAKGRGRFLLHLKGPWPNGALDTLVALVRSKGLRRQAVVIDYSINTLAHVRQVDPALTVGLLTTPIVDTTVLHRLGNAVLLFYDSTVVATPQAALTDLRNDAMGRGNAIGSWTIYGMEKAKALRAKGAGWLITDVELSKETLAEIALPNN